MQLEYDKKDSDLLCMGLCALIGECLEEFSEEDRNWVEATAKKLDSESDAIWGKLYAHAQADESNAQVKARLLGLLRKIVEARDAT